jgi:DNA-binding response OmpR family regulator
MPNVVFLFAEDSEVDALFVKLEFARHPGVRLMIVKDGQEAIDYLVGGAPFNDRQQFPTPDVMLLDIKMPRISGFDFLKWRREEAPEDVRLMPVIVLSGSDLLEDVRRAYLLGANRYTVKCGNLDLLRERVTLMVQNWGRHTELVNRAEFGLHSAA